MTRRAFFKKHILRAAAALLPVALIVYTVYHVFGSSSGALMTAPARRITDRRVVEAEGWVFRDERVLTVSSEGLVENVAEVGAKVSRGSTLVRVYALPNGESASASQLKLDAIERMLAVLDASEVSAGTTLSKAEGYRAEAGRIYGDLRRLVTSGGKWSSVSGMADEMLAWLNRYKALTDADTDYAAQREELLSERRELLSGDALAFTASESSGYYYSREYVDGRESVFRTEVLENMTVEQFHALQATPAASTEGSYPVGKLVTANRCYLAVELNADGAAAVSEGERCAVTFPANGERELTLACTRLIPDPGGGAVAVFASDEVPPDFVYLRTQPVTLTVGTTKGFYVPEAAMREVEGVEGVFIFEIGTVYFRPVKVLWRGDGYCIVAEESEGNCLELNDMMVTSNEELYDGRVFK